MWIRAGVLCLLSACAGAAVSAGVFALLTSLGELTRIIARTKTANRLLLYENMVILGGMCGSLFSVFEPRLPVGSLVLTIWMFGAGMHVGCLIMALTEVVDAFPILFRRMKIKVGMNCVVLSMAVGKIVGSIYYFTVGLGR